MKLNKFSNYESEYVPEHNCGKSIVDPDCYIPQSVRIKNILASGQALINLAPKAQEFEQFGTDGQIDESYTETVPDFCDIAELDSILKNRAEQINGTPSVSSYKSPTVQNGSASAEGAARESSGSVATGEKS